MSVFTAPRDMAPDEIAEEAMGLIAVAMFRSKEQTGSHRDAIETAEAFISTLSSMTTDFRRALAKENPGA